MLDQHVAPSTTGVHRTVLGTGKVPPTVAPAHEGRTVAAWTTVTIVLIGAVVAARGVAFALPWLGWTGGGVIVIGAVACGVLCAAGRGQPKPKPKPKYTGTH